MNRCSNGSCERSLHVFFANYVVTYRMKESMLTNQLKPHHYDKCKDFAEVYRTSPHCLENALYSEMGHAGSYGEILH